MPTLAHDLAAKAAEIRFESLSPAVVHEVKRRILDSIGTALGAHHSSPARSRARSPPASVSRTARACLGRVTAPRPISRPSQTARWCAISTSTTLTSPSSRHTRRTTFPQRWRSGRSPSAARATSSRPSRWRMRYSAGIATRPRCASTAGITSAMAPCRVRWPRRSYGG
ncbi:MAG: MmgE/PrpD family protein [Phycisphaerales bacterium]|nr:MmgE/PrpD family protein [Phycisphaerales bacterium]